MIEEFDQLRQSGIEYCFSFRGSTYRLTVQENADKKCVGISMICEGAPKSLEMVLKQQSEIVSVAIGKGMTFRGMINDRGYTQGSRHYSVEGVSSVKFAETEWDATYQILSARYEPVAPGVITRPTKVSFLRVVDGAAP